MRSLFVFVRALKFEIKRMMREQRRREGTSLRDYWLSGKVDVRSV